MTMAEGTLSAIYSDNANAWTVGAVGEMEPSGLRVTAVGATAAEMGGVLYIPVKLTDGTTFWNALVATDGAKFKWLPAFWRGTEADGGKHSQKTNSRRRGYEHTGRCYKRDLDIQIWLACYMREMMTWVSSRSAS